MNYAPEVKALGPGRWRAEGLMFHMPGKWEFVFEIRAAGKSDRIGHAFSAFAILEGRNRQDPAARSVAAAGGPRSEQSRLGQARGDRFRREALLRAAALGHRLGAVRDLPRALPRLPGRPAARLRPRGSGSQYAERDQHALLPLVRLGRRARQPVVAEHPAAARRARNALEPAEGRRRSCAPCSQKSTRRHSAASCRPTTRQVLVDVGKALAAYQETLVSGRTAFDDFRDASGQQQTQ